MLIDSEAEDFMCFAIDMVCASAAARFERDVLDAFGISLNGSLLLEEDVAEGQGYLFFETTEEKRELRVMFLLFMRHWCAEEGICLT